MAQQIQNNTYSVPVPLVQQLKCSAIPTHGSHLLSHSQLLLAAITHSARHSLVLVKKSALKSDRNRTCNYYGDKMST